MSVGPIPPFGTILGEEMTQPVKIEVNLADEDLKPIIDQAMLRRIKDLESKENSLSQNLAKAKRRLGQIRDGFDITKDIREEILDATKSLMLAISELQVILEDARWGEIDVFMEQEELD